MGRLGWLVAVFCVGVCLAGFPARAQSAEPAAEHVLRAHAAVRGWLNVWSVVEGRDDAVPVITARVSGVCVTLRLPDGSTARGTAWEKFGAATPSEAERVGKTVELLRTATRAAMADAEPKLGVPNDARREEALRLLGAQCVLSVELAGALGVIEPKTWDDAEVELRPGLIGVAVRKVNATGAANGGGFAAVFPSQMMLSSQLPSRTLGRVVSEVVGEGGAAAALEEPAQIRAKQGVRMLVFHVAHAVQASPSGPAMVLYRGQRLIPAGTVMTRAELGEMARRLAAHLERRLVSERVALTKDVAFDGRRVQSVPSDAPGNEPTSLDGAALVGLALTRAGESLNKPETLLAGRLTLDSVRAKLDLQDRLAMAIVGIGERSDVPGAWRSEEVTREVRRRRASLNAQPADGPAAMASDKIDANVAGFLALNVGDPEGEKAAGAAMPSRAEDQLRFVESVLRPQLAKLRPETMVSAMPSMGWACLRLARARMVEKAWKATLSGARPDTASGERSVEEEIPAAVSLRRMRELCWAHQIQLPGATSDTLDMVGGIIFSTEGGGRGTPYPTWQCVRPLVFIATMLGDTRLTEPGERGTEIVKLMTALRFMRQLEVDEGSSWMYPSPTLAMGGIRASTWDNALPAEATAITLLCVLEAADALDRVAAESAGKASGGATVAKPRWFEEGLMDMPERTQSAP